MSDPTPERPKPGGWGYIPFPERFWMQVDQTGDCWRWVGTTNNRGYGVIQIAGKKLLTHRVSYELTHGAIPDGMQVLHACDNPPCVRPEHLWLGTRSDNMRDMYDKDRHPRTGPKKNTAGPDE